MSIQMEEIQSLNKLPDSVTLETFQIRLKQVSHPREHAPRYLRARMVNSILEMGKDVAIYHCGENSNATTAMQEAIVMAKVFSYRRIYQIPIRDDLFSGKQDLKDKLKRYFRSCLEISSKELNQGEYFKSIKEGLSFLPSKNVIFLVHLQKEWRL